MGTLGMTDKFECDVCGEEYLKKNPTDILEKIWPKRCPGCNHSIWDFQDFGLENRLGL